MMSNLNEQAIELAIELGLDHEDAKEIQNLKEMISEDKNDIMAFRPTQTKIQPKYYEYFTDEMAKNSGLDPVKDKEEIQHLREMLYEIKNITPKRCDMYYDWLEKKQNARK